MALTKLTDIRKSLSVEIEDLQVNGITTFTGNVSVGGTLTYQDVTNIDSVGLITARSGIHVSGGKLGIGTDNAASDLHINSAVPTIRFTDSDTSHYSDILQSGHSLYISGDRGSSGSGGIIFRTQGTNERLRIDSNGNITQGVSGDATFAAINSISANAARGIEIFKDGTDTGSAIKLAGDNGSGNKAYSQLGYSGANATVHLANYNTSGTKVGEISITADGVIETGTAVGASGADGNQRLRVGRAGDCNIAVRATASTTAFTGLDFGDQDDDRAGRIQYGHQNNYMSFHTNGAGSGSSNERLRIESTGEVWVKTGTLKLGSTSGTDSIIHTTNAAGILYRADENGHRFQTYSGSWKDRLTITDAGKVGIGTNNPTQILNIYGTNLKPVIGDRTAHTPLYASYNGQNNTSLEITSSGTGTNVAGLTINNPTTSANSSYKTISFSCSGTSSSEKRACIISSNHDEDGSSSLKGNFYVSTNNGSGLQQNLQIDHDGNVTKPNSFHILVDRNGNQTGYNACDMTSVILWNRVQSSHSSTGAANYFNTSNGLFTAPKTGLYLFHVAVNCSYAVQGAWLNINGSRPSFANFYPNGANSADAMITYKVTEGHTVGVKWYYNCITNGTINSNTLHTWWRIILLG